MSSPLLIDGGLGEGGGQVLRSALALSLATGQAFRLVNIRAGRKKPGLLRQHLTAVQLATAVGAAHTEGDALGSKTLLFEPTTLQGGEHHVQVGSAGSTVLVVQAVLPALLFASEPTTIVVEGGTHARFAPPFEYFRDVFLVALGHAGHYVNVTLERPGFYPTGGGRLRVQIDPTPEPQALDLRARGRRVLQEATSIYSGVPRHVAERELAVVSKKLGWPRKSLHIQERTDAAGPGNALLLHLGHEHSATVCVAYGSPGVPAERVARDACAQAKRWLGTTAPVDRHLADQLMVPLALGAGGVYRTLPLTPHGTTNRAVIEHFLAAPIQVDAAQDDCVDVRIRGRP